jgi:sugar phosphate isomerase/epimerase
MPGTENPELAKLEAENRQLKDRAAAQERELALLRARFARYETALRGSQVTVYTQDRDLRYTSISNLMGGHAVEDVLGRTDAEMFPQDGAVALGCGMLMSAPGQVNGPIKDAIKYLKDAGDIAAEYKLKLAIEFNSQHDVLNSLAVLTELIEGANQPNCGYLIDAYHFTRSGAGGRRFESVPAEKLYCFQYSDLSPTPVTGVRRPTDRLPPGKGVVKWREMLGLLAEKGYTGYLSYEAPNPDQWARSPFDVAREGIELTRKLLRDAVPTYVS